MEDSDPDLNDNFERVTRRAQSKEAIKKLEIDEKLTDMERVAVLLRSTHSLQQYSLVRNLPQLLIEHKAPMMTFMKENFPGFISKASCELQALAAQSVFTMLTSPAAELRPPEVYDGILPLALLFLNKLSTLDANVASAWKETFYEILSQLPVSALKGEVLQFAVEKGQFSERPIQRVLACHTFGKLAELLDAKSVEEGYFGHAMSLCQDTDYEVRIAMCNQLGLIAKCVSHELLNQRLLTELLELLRDEVLEVRIAAFEAVVALLETLEVQVRRERIVPLLKGLMREMPDDMRLNIAQSYGKFLCKIVTDIVGDGDSLLFYETFKTLAEHPQTEVRRACAFNFPAVVKCIGAPKYALHLHPTLDKLAQDREPAVRRAIAAGLHEIAILLGEERTASSLKGPFLRLCADQAPEVAETLLVKLDVVLKRFCIGNEEERARVYTEIVPQLMILEKTIEHRWRLQHAFVCHFPTFAQCFASNEMYEHLVPVLYRMMRAAAHQVKQEAAKALCVLIRKNKYNFQRRDLCQRLIREFARGRSFSHRMVFLDTCQHLIDCFSRRFFKANFLELVLSLTEDKVANVRIRICALLPSAKKMVVLPHDMPLLEKLEHCAKSLCSDGDRDVVLAAADMQALLDAIPVREAGETRLIEEDRRDLALEDEENNNDDEEEQDELTEAAMRRYLNSGDKTGRTKPGGSNGTRRSFVYAPAPDRRSSTMYTGGKANATSSMSASSMSRTASGGVPTRSRRGSFEGKKDPVPSNIVRQAPASTNRQALPPTHGSRRKEACGASGLPSGRSRDALTISDAPNTKPPSAGRRRSNSIQNASKK